MLFPRNVGWVCVPLPRTLTLFIIQIYNFCFPFYDLLIFKIRYPIYRYPGTVALNISYGGLLLTDLLIIMRTWLLQEIDPIQD